MTTPKTKTKARARFRRETPEERRRQLGEAALRCIVKNGNAGVSVRQIAAEAGVTQGLITHHFGEINELVAYAFDIMSTGLMQSILKSVHEAEPTPKARLDAFIAASFSPIMLDRDVLGVWVVFWGLILHSPRMSMSQQQEYTDYVATVEGLLGDLAAAERFTIGDLKLTAMAFTALMDGLWLAWCLNPDAFRPEDGVRLCNNWIEGLRRGAYA
ncbi:TetR/AcrR family transcriptional regulator [Rhizobium alvei]|uniref:TetR family transcriptional regulator C-terminal domain-containing protein n=1 Tax=Rhizobium alvei TaxID=1132659 RepID=A0ABT8YT00_9HYPH|nr:TetR family transcriptional regulator C-terminal domain-containing protein [Rhizobium alvei]MDO6966340.1 TetR family transcriptional regulator C-terminal domain-containing protein [Rhizobium alvei]